MEKIRAILKKIIMSAAILAALISCTPTNHENPEIHGLISPHHLFVESYMDELYAANASDTIQRVILISPNHFNYGQRYIQGTDLKISEACPEIDVDFMRSLQGVTPLSFEPKRFELEHGLFAHFSLINKYYPNATLAPIILKQGTPEKQLNILIAEILKQDLSNTLVIGSIDFTHYEDEKIAVLNDDRTVEWLENWAEGENDDYTLNDILLLAESTDASTDEAIAMDSPETFYSFIRIMDAMGEKALTIHNRTSSASLTGLEDPMQNTSHIFVSIILKVGVGTEK